MTKELRRKQKKAKKAARNAKRRITMTTRPKGLQFDPELPTTQAAIEAEIQRLLPRLNRETPDSDDFDDFDNFQDHCRTIVLTLTMIRIRRLQVQLFLVVFRRRPKFLDPLFWDRDRESLGVFPLDPDKATNDLAYFYAMAGSRPEIDYAKELTGMFPMKQNLHLYPKEALGQWQAAVDDYVHQAATGVAPLDPDTFMNAVEIMGEVAEQPIARLIRSAGISKTALNRMVVAIESELGTREKAETSLARIAALVAITDEEEFKHLATPDDYPENVLIAAASAEIDRQTGRFDPQSFRERLKAAEVLPEI